MVLLHADTLGLTWPRDTGSGYILLIPSNSGSHFYDQHYCGGCQPGTAVPGQQAGVVIIRGQVGLHDRAILSSPDLDIPLSGTLHSLSFVSDNIIPHIWGNIEALCWHSILIIIALLWMSKREGTFV